MEFDKSKILTVVTADQAIAYKKGWFSNDIPSLKIYIQRGDEPKGLQSVDFHNEYPFRESYLSDGSFACKYRYFYPAPEPAYAERQAEWLKETGLKVGDKVRITRKAHDEEEGWGTVWENSMDEYVGKIGVVEDISSEHGIRIVVDVIGWWYPYFVLEPVKETYRPFANAEEFKPYRDEWFTSKFPNGEQSHFKVIDYFDTGIVSVGGYSTDSRAKLSFCTYSGMFKWVTRENGEPCGIKEEV